MIDETINFHTLLKVTPEAFHGVAAFGATDRDEDIVYDGLEYKTSLGYVPAAYEDDTDLAPGNSEVEGFLNSIGISRAMIEKGVFDNAFLELMLYDSLTNTVVKTLMTGYWGRCTLYKNRYVAEFRSIAYKLQHSSTILISQTCRATLGDAKCGVNLTTYTTSGTVEAMDLSKLYFKDSSIIEEDNYYTYGYVEWLTGSNAGSKGEIAQYAAGEFRLFEPATFTIATGDTFNVIAGCNKLPTTCQNTFSNMINFRGEPYLPGEAFVKKIYEQ